MEFELVNAHSAKWTGMIPAIPSATGFLLPTKSLEHRQVRSSRFKVATLIPLPLRTLRRTVLMRDFDSRSSRSKTTRNNLRNSHQVTWFARRNNLTASCSAIRAEVDDPVGGSDDVLVVLNDEHAVAL